MRQIALFLVFSLVFGVSVFAQEATEPPPEVTPESTEVLPDLPPEPDATIEGDGIFLDIYFRNLEQGRAGLVGLRGDDIEGARANVFSKNIDFFQIDDRDGWWAVIGASMGQSIRQYDLQVTVDLGDDEPQVLLVRFNVINGGFIGQTVTLVPDEQLETLLSPEVEEAELAFIFERAVVTDEVYWSEDSFISPAGTELTSPFGAVRTFNDELQTVHTGWDYNAPTGTPLLSTAGGRVAFAGELDIRGNYVLVDHGQGIYSGYAHMAVIYVTEGQTVSEGQVLGTVGSTGRSSSAHAHFEMIVHDEWIDPVDFVWMYMP